MDENPENGEVEEESVDEMEVSKSLKRYEKSVPGQFFFLKVAKYEVLSHEEVVKLAKRKDGNDLEARELLIMHNFRYVIHLANKYSYLGERDDLIQEGNIGLMHAVDKFDWSKGFRLSTYATYWIRQKMLRMGDNTAGPVRVPVHARELRRKIRKVIEILTYELKRPPTLDEVIEETGGSRDHVKSTIEHHSEAAFSLNQAISESESHTQIQDSFADENSFDPRTIVLAREELKEIGEKVSEFFWELKNLANVSERDLEVFKSFYGLRSNMEPGVTLEAVGLEFELTRERIRQLIEMTWVKANKFLSAHHLNHFKFSRLLEDAALLEQAVGGSVSLSGMIGLLEKKVKPNTDSEAKNPSKNVKIRKNTKRILHFRASPQYSDWTGVTGNLPVDIQEFVGAAYEFSGRDLASSRKKLDIIWARKVAVYMCMEFKLQPCEISTHFRGLNSSVEGIRNEIQGWIDSDELVSKDILGMVSHFRKISGR